MDRKKIETDLRAAWMEIGEARSEAMLNILDEMMEYIDDLTKKMKRYEEKLIAFVAPK